MSLHDIQVSKRFQDSSIIKVFKHKECLLFLEKLGIQICEKHSNAKIKLVLHLPSRLSAISSTTASSIFSSKQKCVEKCTQPIYD